MSKDIKGPGVPPMIEPFLSGFPPVYQVSKVMLVGAVIQVLQNGRPVNELTITHPEGQIITLFAHPTHTFAWGGSLEAWLDTQLTQVGEDAAPCGEGMEGAGQGQE